MKHTLLKLMMATGTFAPFRFANRHKALILMYHRFSESENDFAISQEIFTQHLLYLKKRYSIVTLSELAGYLNEKKPLPKNTAAITIDDGYSDVYEIAFPVLKKFNVPATVFVVTNFVDNKEWIWTDKMRYVLSQTKEQTLEVKIAGKTLEAKLNGAHSRFRSAERINDILKRMGEGEKRISIERIADSLNVEIPVLPPAEFAPISWEDARELDRNNVSVESHTVTHPILTNVCDEQLQVELKESRIRLESELERAAKIFCYPNGNYDERVRLAVERAGYDCAVTTMQGFNEIGADLFSLKRLDAEFDIEHFAQTTSGFELLKNKLWR